MHLQTFWYQSGSLTHKSCRQGWWRHGVITKHFKRNNLMSLNSRRQGDLFFRAKRSSITHVLRNLFD